MISVISDCVLATVRTIAFISVLLIAAPFNRSTFQCRYSYNKVVGVLAGHPVPVSAISANYANPFGQPPMVAYRT
jgi:hypothetical protein